MQKDSKVPEVLFLCVVVAVAVAVLVMSRGFSFRAFLLPVVGVVPAGLLALYQLGRLARGLPSESDASGPLGYDAAPTGEDDESPAQPGATSEPLAPHWLAFAWLAGFTMAVYFLGLLWGSLIFIVLYMKFRGGEGMLPIAVVLLATGGVLLVLVNFLGAPIYRGSLF